MRVCDYIAEYLYSIGIRYVFGVAGGGASGLNDGFAKFKKIEYISCHHEQSAANAAVGYSKFNYKLSVVNPTTGCGGLNCVTPLCSAFQDHVPVLFISGNVAENQTTKFFREQKGIKLRKLGVQEADIIEVVKPLCKYAVTLNKPENVAYELQKAISIALQAPMGPVWIDIPANVQNALIDESITNYVRNVIHFKDLFAECASNYIEGFIKDLKCYNRPLILAGNGINLSNTREEFKQFVEKYDIPFITTFLGVDIIEGNHPLYIGRVGIKGTRAGNFALQNCDLLLILGTSLNIPVSGYMAEKFAPQAEKIVIDVNIENHSKNTVKIDKIIKIDLKDFFKHTNIDEIRGRTKYAVTLDDFYFTNGFVSPGIPSWAKPLPEKLDIGKKVKVVNKGHSWIGRSGEIIQHYINADDCGDWGQHYYCIKDKDGVLFSVRVEYCEVYNK